MKRVQIGLSIIVLTLALISSSSFAENHSDAPSSVTQETTGQRATKADPLTEREIDFIAKHFFLSKTSITQKYAEKLPLAIEKAMKDGDEKESSQIIAQMMGMVNKKQAELVLENAKKEKESENSKKPNGGDDRYIALMERFIWGSKLFLKTPSKEESAEKYNQEFQEAFKGVAAKNEEILEKIKQAVDGNDQAKDWLRKNIDPNSLLSFVEGQKKYGNGELADRVLDAMSFKEGKNKFLDMSLPNETQRLHLGQTSKSVSTALDKFIENKKGFNGALVSLTPHKANPSKQWFVDSSGSFRTGPPSNKVITSVATNGGNSSVTSSTSSGGNNSSNSGGGGAAAHAKIIQTCNQCHAGDISIDANGVLSKEGSPRTKAEILDAFNQVRQMAQPTAKLPAAERAQVMALISQWLK